MSKTKPSTFTTPIMRASYPQIFEAKLNIDKTAKKFTIVGLIPKSSPDIEVFKKAVMSTIIEKWGADKTKWPRNLKNPIRDGDIEKPDVEGYAGHFFITFSANEDRKPGVVGPDLQPILSASEFYGGMFFRASVNAFAYDKQVNKGVAFGLNHVQKVKDGPRFGSYTPIDGAFDAVDSQISGEDNEENYSFM